MQVELLHISKRFGSVWANQDISLTIAPGTVHGLLGENGAGKSTLVKILSGFMVRDRGEIRLDGRSQAIGTPAAAIQAGIGMLHQDPLDFPALSVLENFLVGQSHHCDRRRALRTLQTLCQQFNFRLESQTLVSQLTVGERQQLELVRLLSLGIKTLILDEPTTGISAVQTSHLFAAVKQLAAAGKSIIFVSHKLEDVANLCDEVTILRQGRVAGRSAMPCPEATLIDLMFGQELALPKKVSMVQPQPLVQLQDLTIAADRRQIQIDDLTIHPGEVIGLAGLEGSGQDLLLQCCAGLLPPIAGQIWLHHQGQGQNLAQQPYTAFRQAGVGYLPADRLQAGLIRGLTIQEHMALRSRPRRGFVDWAGTLRQAQQAITLFNIQGSPTSFVERLSGGNQQRTQLALLPMPSTLLLMEHPTRGLDAESASWIWQQLMARCQGGTAILFTSSDLDEIMQYSDRVLVFSGGQISAPIPVQQLTLDCLGQMMAGRFQVLPSLQQQESN